MLANSVDQTLGRATHTLTGSEKSWAISVSPNLCELGLLWAAPRAPLAAPHPSCWLPPWACHESNPPCCCAAISFDMIIEQELANSPSLWKSLSPSPIGCAASGHHHRGASLRSRQLRSGLAWAQGQRRRLDRLLHSRKRSAGRAA